MRYIFIPLIALGFTLTCIIGIEYKCVGSEMFPTYYGSPFIFKVKSLGSSMEYYYSLSGLVLNVGIWSIFLSFVRYLILKLLDMIKQNKIVKIFYKTFIGVLLIYSFLSIFLTYIGLGRGFDKNLNYWYFNLEKEANEWDVKCEGEWKIFIL